MTTKEYTQEELAAQPIGYWSGEAYRAVVGRIRAELAVEQLTQPHWWTLNHVAGAAGRWSRTQLAERLAPFDDLGIDFEEVFDDLVARGWMSEQAGTLSLTEAGEAGRLRAKERNSQAHEQMHQGIATDDYVAALNVLRRMIANLGGNSDLP
ncbi:MarR family transcriptional regulator [Micromonospora sp. U21]|uniref:MarR family transcriptional regulator n=1 Tax=Micromonospora sp. U21 TaxID=2824899 RepID=UPI001B396FE5|nr:MarR family transcriptional regulator [Micromonospora sp. U21]MBQ0905769.1 MarR family transcriptional regulator [Micromonospora sp. U21]